MTLYTETYGSGEPLVLVHGWAMHSGIWRHFAEQLGRHCQAICVDLPGHGRSPMLPFTLEHVRAALLETLPERPCHWLGWSLGAKIVLDIAAHCPKRVKSVVLLAGNPCFKRNDGWPGMDRQALENFAAALEADCQTVLQRFLGLQVHAMENHKQLAKALKQAVLECPAPDLETLRGGLEILERADLTPALATLQCPLHAILGGRDTLVPAAVGEAIEKLAPHAQVCRIAKAGHVPFITHEQQVIDTLCRFMGLAL
jgi:pimeloyl-[acyl-carrier protein] methyl ester esterase